jgi:serine/threonine-protein kinase
MPAIYTTGARIDHYQILRQLGRGGASHVYLAQDLHALQEVVRGRTLREVLQKRAPEKLPIEEVLHILNQVCSALAYAHEQGVIHRDIKPENIMLLENGDSKIFDFGIALLEGKRPSRMLVFASPIGTPDYMAPELLLGAPGDKRAAIYAVGVVLYELLCRRTPFEEQDGFALVTRHISHDPPGVLQFNATVPPALATVVMRAIRRDPEKRYASMHDLLFDLQHLDRVTVVTYSADPPRIGGRYLQVMRIALIVLIACVCIVAFGLFAQFAHHLVR